ncbi:hypothetical protein [Bacillus sp. AK128]
MTNKEYQEIVEERYGKSLRDIMYEMCVLRNVSKWEGAQELGVPDKTFLKWRTKFRFGPDQLRYDEAERYNEELIDTYKNQLENTNLIREFEYKEEISLRGFKELSKRMLEVEKLKRTNIEGGNYSNIESALRIGTLETMIDYLNRYERGELYESFLQELMSIDS